MNSKLTVEAARRSLQALGMTIRVRDGEYRVSPNVYELQRRLGLDFKPATDLAEDRAYYTQDIIDAVSTGVHMSEHAFTA